MSQNPTPKFSPEYKVVLYATILRCVEKDAQGQSDQRIRDALFLARQQVRKATDELSKVHS